MHAMSARVSDIRLPSGLDAANRLKLLGNKQQMKRTLEHETTSHAMRLQAYIGRRRRELCLTWYIANYVAVLDGHCKCKTIAVMTLNVCYADKTHTDEVQ